jgi:hypothetical protein
MVHFSNQSIAPTQDRQTQLDAVPETMEEKLQTENYILKEERKLLQQKYDRVLDQNRRWNSKDVKSERTMAAQKAEIARLETRNMRTRQELAEAGMDAAGLNIRNAELEELCREYADEIHAVEKRFDDYVRDITQLTAQFRRRPPNPTTRGEHGRAFRSEAAMHSAAENLQSTTANPLLPVARTEHDLLSPLPPHPDEMTRISETMPPPRMKKEDQDQAQVSTSTSATTSVVSPNTTLALRPLSSSPGHIQTEQRHSISSSTLSRREAYRRNSKMPEESCRKRAVSPIDTRDSSFEEGRRHKYPRQTANSTNRTGDPHPQFRRA